MNLCLQPLVCVILKLGIIKVALLSNWSSEKPVMKLLRLSRVRLCFFPLWWNGPTFEPQKILHNKLWRTTHVWYVCAGECSPVKYYQYCYYVLYQYFFKAVFDIWTMYRQHTSYVESSRTALPLRGISHVRTIQVCQRCRIWYRKCGHVEISNFDTGTSIMVLYRTHRTRVERVLPSISPHQRIFFADTLVLYRTKKIDVYLHVYHVRKSNVLYPVCCVSIWFLVYRYCIIRIETRFIVSILAYQSNT